MVAALVRIFGVASVDLAEDVVQETLCRALDAWKYGPVPANPAAWLMASAKNRAIDVIRRERSVRKFSPDIAHLLQSEWTLRATVDDLFLDEEIRDGELRMMFSCCHPKLGPPAQMAVILKLLCGFSVGEIGRAFLASEAAIEKRLQRALEVLASSGALFEVRGRRAIAARLPTVCRAVYLLFNEGYHASHSESAVRDDLCRAALRLSALLIDHPLTRGPRTHALAALCCLNAARLPARVDAEGALVLLDAQDRSLWDRELMGKGLALLDASSVGDRLTEYHLEAAIAAKHGTAESFAATDWQGIVELYDVLLRLRPSPVVALNRAIAISRARGPEEALAEIAQIAGSRALERYRFLPAVLGELHARAGRPEVARGHLERALALARGASEVELYRRKLAACGG